LRRALSASHLGAGMRIELNSSHCDDNRFSMDQANSDHSIVRCLDCGHLIGTLASLKERIADEVLKRGEHRT
jgi:hypothetical protein